MNIPIIKEEWLKNVQIGGWQTIASPLVTEALLSTQKFSWLGVDCEHSSISLWQVEEICIAARNFRIPILVRVPNREIDFARKSLDCGASGVIVSNVQKLREILEFRKNLFFPPHGSRGLYLNRTNLWGDQFNEYRKLFRPFICIQIEDVKALEELDNLLDPEYIDAAFIGPYDLSASIGCPGNFNDSKFLQIKKQIIDKANDKHIPIGSHIIEPVWSNIDSAINNGEKLLAFSTDALCLRYAITKRQR